MASGTKTPQKKSPQKASKTQTRRTQRLPTGGGSSGGGLVEHLRDIWAVGLLVLAALAALGVYADAAGAAGVYLDLALRGLLGVFGLGAPVALAAGGGILLLEPRPGTRRVTAGLALLALGVMGLYHLAVGAPGFSAAVPALQRASGWVGAGLLGVLLPAVGAWGSAVVLAALIAVGAMVVSAVPPRVLGETSAAGARAARRRLAERRARVAEARAARREERQHPDEDDEAGDLPPAAPDPASTGAPSPDAGGSHSEPVFEGLSEQPAEGAHGQGSEPSDTQLLPRGIDTSEGDGAGRTAPAGQTDAGYQLPSLDMLRHGREAPGNKQTLDQMTRQLEHALHQFGVNAHVARVSRGPTVTRFEISLGEGVKVAAVTKLGDDISYALATPEIRIVAPIPGKSAIGVEVPNRERDLITLGDVLRSEEAASQGHPLATGIGRDIAGNPVLLNLGTMPHLLIAGATGSGKSVTTNAIITSVIMRSTPAEVRMILIDPKRVELNHYEGAPHLLTPVVADPKRATEALEWTLKEMERRYERLASLGYRNIDSYNEAVREGRLRPAGAAGDGHAGDASSPDTGAGERPGADTDTGGPGAGQRSGEGHLAAPLGEQQWETLPYILVVIDELADLMMIAPRDVESAVVRIAQMARAVGIHLVVATQRPSVDVVTGLIKANVPSRIALAMATGHDSKTILDQYGAEKLVGHGDMLFMPANASRPHRIQGCYVDEGEIEEVVAFCKNQWGADYARGVVRQGEDAAIADVQGEDANDTDLTREAMKLVVRSGLGSTSMLQRKLKVGFARAGRLMDELEDLGVVGPSQGPKAREVLMSVEELDARLGDQEAEQGPSTAG